MRQEVVFNSLTDYVSRSTLRAMVALLLIGAGFANAKEYLHPGDLTTERVALATEWRDAMKVPAGNAVTLDLGASTGATALRLGVLAGKDAAGQVTFTVQPSAGKDESYEVTGKSWRDFRIDLRKAARSGAAVRVTFSSRKPFWIGPCEVVRAKDRWPNVLVFLIDTLRQDHLRCYGYARATSPNIDAFRKDAVMFTDLMPQCSWTRPSVASLFTSTYPNVHGAENSRQSIRDGIPRLARSLQKAGYETQGFISNPHCLPRWGFGEGFTRYVDIESITKRKGMQDDAHVIDAVLRTLPFVRGRPWYFYVHTMSPHSLYQVPKPRDTIFFKQDPTRKVDLNGDFEESDGPAPKGWTVQANTPGSWTLTHNPVHSGHTAVSIAGPGVMYSRSFPVRPGDGVDVTFWALSKGDQPEKLVVRVDGRGTGDWRQFDPGFRVKPTEGDWAPYSRYHWLVPKDTTQARLVVTATSGPTPNTRWFLDGITCGVATLGNAKRVMQSIKRRIIDTYDGKIHYVDEQFGRLVSGLKKLGLYDNTLIILVADHGEEFHDHGWFSHGVTLYEEMLRVPCLIKLPKNVNAGQTRKDLVQMVDVAPTILDAVGAPPNPQFEGCSFYPYLTKGIAPKRKIGFAEVKHDAIFKRAVKTASSKFIVDLKAHKEFWFDLVADPKERKPLTEPARIGPALQQYMIAMTQLGAAGIHILITKGDRDGHLVTGALQAAGLKDPKLHCSDSPPVLTVGKDSVQFRADLREPAHHVHYGADTAELTAQLNPDDPVHVTIQVDGAPIAKENVFLGANLRHAELDGAPLDVNDITDAFTSHQASELPHAWGVYVWYVKPAPKQENKLDPAILRALHGIGYLN